MHLLQCIICMWGLNTTCSFPSYSISVEFKQYFGKERERKGGKKEGEGERTVLHWTFRIQNKGVYQNLQHSSVFFLRDVIFKINMRMVHLIRDLLSWTCSSKDSGNCMCWAVHKSGLSSAHAKFYFLSVSGWQNTNCLLWTKATNHICSCF